MQKKWIIGGAVVAVVAVAIVGALATGALGPRGTGEAPPTMARSGPGGDKPEVPLAFTPREVTRPALARMASMVEFSGPLVAPRTATLRARAGGTLLELAVAEGHRVAAGQPVGRLDLAEVSSRVAERSAMVESARAALAQAERQHGSNERLAAQQFISPNALETSRAALDTARASLAAAQASLDTTRVALRDAALVAPIAGIVARRHVLPGEKLSPEQEVLTIVDLKTLELAGLVGTHEVSRLAPGMAVELRVEGVEQPIAGEVARIAPAAEPGTRSIGVIIAVANADERLRAGQYAVGRVRLADDTERLTLPETAVAGSSGQEHVWVIEDGQLVRRAVTLGKRDGREGRVEVLQGVTPASVVLAARFDNLREGRQAQVAESSSADKASPVASAAASSPPRH